MNLRTFLVFRCLESISKFLAHFHHLLFKILHLLVLLADKELKVLVLRLEYFELVLGARAATLTHLLEPYDFHMELAVLLHDSLILFLQGLLLYKLENGSDKPEL